MIDRKTTLHCVLSPTAFEDINKDAFISTVRPLGTGVASVGKMIACAEEMEFLLPDILSISPKSTDTNWASAVSNYWHNFGLDVPFGTGKTFNISLQVDLNDPLRKANIDKFLKENAPKAEDTNAKIKAIETFLRSKDTPETIKYRYAIPVDVVDYLAWRYCLVSSLVANDPELVKKSTNIEFYLMDEARAEERKEAAAKLRNDAIRKYSELISDKDATRIDNLLVATDLVKSLKDLTKMSRADKENMIMDLVTFDATKFITTLENKQLETTSEIKKWVLAGLINNLPNSIVFVDASDSSLVLGNGMKEVVTYISNPINAAYVNELKVKFNALTF